MPATGRLIAIEGTDGSGKATQSKLFAQWLQGQGHDVQTADFPRYHQPSAYFVEKYLSGGYGDLAANGPYRSSLFYALDRFDASFGIRQALAAGKTVVTDRYVGSNMGHQGSKIASASDRRDYFVWNEHLEYDILGLPRPDLNIFLHMPTAIARRLIDQRGRHDLHEDDQDHLEKAEQSFMQVCEIFPQAYVKIECAISGQPRAIADIQAEIQELARQRHF
jgi:dTMP kinase